MYSFYFAVGIDEFCRGCTACSYDCLSLVHYEDIIITLKALSCISDIFEVIESIFLTVEIIREIIILHKPINAVINHFRNSLMFACVFKKVSGTLYSERMDGNAFWI